VSRSRFCQLAVSKLGSVVLWNHDGPSLFDCSGLVCWSLREVGGRDMSTTHNAQRLYDETTAVSSPSPGDLCFYGLDARHVIHVAIWVARGRVVSADGATSRVLDVKAARANLSARVRMHPAPEYRRDFLSVRRNIYLDDLPEPPMPDVSNPHRLAGSPAMGEPALGSQPVAVVERSPTGLALLPQIALKIATVLVVIAGVIVTLPSAGIALPPVVLAIAGAVLALGTALGIASQGVRVHPGTQPVTLAAPAPVPSSPSPRIGPPAP